VNSHSGSIFAHIRWPHFTWGVALRMVADAIMIQAALIMGLVLRLLIFVWWNQASPERFAAALESYAGYFVSSGWQWTLICLVIFYVSGFYTYGRHYRGPYKALVVMQAVLQSFVLFGFVNYYITLDVGFPRLALVMAWLFATGMLVGARVWNQLWSHVVTIERQRVHGNRQPQDRLVLVIGGAGYIGSALLPQLLERGFRVRLLDLLLFGEGPIADVADHPRLEIVRGDFRHVETVAQAMDDVDTVVHLGAIVGDPACNLDEDLTIDVNLSATKMIAEIARAYGVKRFVFSSTCSVYGFCDEVLDEHSQPRPISLYGHTKLGSENVLLEMTEDERFCPTVARFGTIFGLSGRTRFDLVVNLFAAKAKIDGEIPLHGGNQWRPFVHVVDAAAALVRIVEAPTELVSGQIYNVGGEGLNYTIREIAEIVREKVIAAEIREMPADGDDRNYRVDFHKIYNELGFVPRWTIEMGVEQVLEAIASGAVTDYRHSIYSNYKFLSEAGASQLSSSDWARRMIREIAADAELAEQAT